MGRKKEDEASESEKRSRSRSRGEGREKKRRKDESDNEEPKEKEKARRTKYDLQVEEQAMQKLLGFATFDTTKGKDHSETAVHGVKKNTKRQYRQYMNRRGGFNRPLDG